MDDRERMGGEGRVGVEHGWKLEGSLATLKV